MQTNNRLFFGTGHSVPRDAPELSTETFGAGDDIVYKPPALVVAARWTAEDCDLAEKRPWEDDDDRCRVPWRQTKLKTPDKAFSLSDDARAVTVHQVQSLPRAGSLRD